MEIAIPIFERLTALDAVGPYEVLSRIPEARVRFVAETIGAKRTENGMLALSADVVLDELPNPEVIVVPGGFGTRALLHDELMLSWLRGAHATSEWTTSVCTGALLLGAAGILEGLEATTHWLSLELLRDYGAIPVSRRVVEQGKVITAAGVSSGIDMALTLAARIAGEDVAQAIQLGIEYDPEPPFDSGSVAKAPADVVERVRRASERYA
jgi:putative intracellular protease/amidase